MANRMSGGAIVYIPATPGFHNRGGGGRGSEGRFHMYGVPSCHIPVRDTTEETERLGRRAGSRISRAGPGESVSGLHSWATGRTGSTRYKHRLSFWCSRSRSLTLTTTAAEERSGKGGDQRVGKGVGETRQMRIRRQGERDAAANKKYIEKKVSLKHVLYN